MPSTKNKLRVGQFKPGRPSKKTVIQRTPRKRGRPPANAVNDRLLLFWVEDSQRSDKASDQPIRPLRRLVIELTSESWERNLHPERPELDLTVQQLKALKPKTWRYAVEATLQRIRRLATKHKALGN